MRMYHESTLHKHSCFATLTYKNPPMSINKRDLQLFFKRLRRLVKVRYFACGEYGTKTRRPHYHAIIFGADFLGGSYEVNETLHAHPYVDRAWGQGFVSLGAVTMESCAYVAGYVNKKIGDADTFNIMSRRPGIGRGWLEKYRDDIVRTGTISIGGRELPIPKKYLEWYEDDFEEIKKERRSYYANLSPQEIWQRRTSLRGKEINTQARIDLQREQL